MLVRTLTPTLSRREREKKRLLLSTTRSQSLALHAPEEFTHDAHVQLVAQMCVLDTGIDGRIVVDLDHGQTLTVLLDIDAVKTVANRCRGFQRELDNIGRRVLDSQGLEAA